MESNRITFKKIPNAKLKYKYEKANQEFDQLMKNPPDLLEVEPIEIYNWVKKLVDLTKK